MRAQRRRRVGPNPEARTGEKEDWLDAATKGEGRVGVRPRTPG